MEISLGVIVPNGTRTRATANETDPTLPLWAASYRVQHWPGNTGTLHVGGSTLEFSSGTGVFGYVPAPTLAEPWPMYESPAHIGPLSNPFDMSQVYLDTEVATDGCLVTYMQA